MCYYVYVWCILWDLYFHCLEILVCNVWNCWIFKLWINEYKEIIFENLIKMCNAVMYMDVGRLFDTLACSREGFFFFFLVSLCVEEQGGTVWMCELLQVLHLVQTAAVDGTMTLPRRTAVLCQHIKKKPQCTEWSFLCIFFFYLWW